MRRLWPYYLLIILAVVHAVSLANLDRMASIETIRENPLYVLPSSIMKIAALDYDGLMADFLFIEGIVYIGRNAETQRRAVRLSLTDAQWRWFYRVMDVASDLDPHFQDPYFLANAFLPWDASMVRETNLLLEKGSRARDWDWRLPFFIGFNYFYLLEENEKAAGYLMEAYRRPGGSPILASIASKLAFKSKRTETAILFLEEIIEKTDDDIEKKRLSARLDALKGIRQLEEAVEKYQTRMKRAPRDLESLVVANVLPDLPRDPFGGRYYLDASGAVRSTTEDLLMPARRQ
jgi:tetratricopeptide (TPR) repeat protein